MTKWEYLYIKVHNDHVEEVNSKSVVKFEGFFSFGSSPSVPEFLEKAGQEGWEAVGICPASEEAYYWRLLFKRPIQ